MRWLRWLGDGSDGLARFGNTTKNHARECVPLCVCVIAEARGNRTCRGALQRGTLWTLHGNAQHAVEATVMFDDLPRALLRSTSGGFQVRSLLPGCPACCAPGGHAQGEHRPAAPALPPVASRVIQTPLASAAGSIANGPKCLARCCSSGKKRCRAGQPPQSPQALQGAA